MYLIVEPICGKLFWEAMGFANTSEKSLENKIDTFEKDVSQPQKSLASKWLMQVNNTTQILHHITRVVEGVIFVERVTFLRYN